jgi:hypothetical protein
LIRIQHLISSRAAVVGLLVAIATIVVAACNNGTGGGPAY